MSKERNDLITIPCRVAFPEVFQPKAAVANGTPKYSVNLLFPTDGRDLYPAIKTGAGLMDLRKAAYNACVEKWGADRSKWPATIKAIDPKTYLSPTGKDGWPFRDGNLVGWEGYEGMTFIRASSKFQPGLVNARLQPILSESEIFGGLIVRCQINAYAYDTNGNRGVTFGLNNVQVLKDDGVVYSGRAKAENVFEAAEPGGFDDGAAAAGEEW